MTSELQQTRYDRLIRRVGGIIGPGSKVSEVLSELFPMIDVERVPGELLALSGTVISIGSLSQAGVVAEFARAQLFNPVDSGKLITLTKVIFSSDTAGIINLGWQAAGITTLATTSSIRDTRFGFTALPVGQMRFASAGFASTADGRIEVIANEPYRLEAENGIAVLGPGSGFEVGADTANRSILATFFWREREAQQSELNF